MPPIILGKEMADNLGAKVGSEVMVTSPQGELTPFGTVPKYTRFKVVGVFKSGFFDYDSSWAFARLSDAQRLFGLGNLITVIEFKVDDIDRAAPIAREIEDAAGKGFMATNCAGSRTSALFNALKAGAPGHLHYHRADCFRRRPEHPDHAHHDGHGEDQRHRGPHVDGHARGQVRNVFIAQGVLIGVIGTAIGLVLGYAIAYAGGHYHVISLSPEVYSIDYVPFAPRIVDGALGRPVHRAGLVRGNALSLVVGSHESSPPEALRYE